ncbi:MAG: hypothetical protein ACOYKZ_07375 [Chlamydiia bacterium]
MGSNSGIPSSGSSPSSPELSDITWSPGSSVIITPRSLGSAVSARAIRPGEAPQGSPVEKVHLLACDWLSEEHDSQLGEEAALNQGHGLGASHRVAELPSLLIGRQDATHRPGGRREQIPEPKDLEPKKRVAFQLPPSNEKPSVVAKGIGQQALKTANQVARMAVGLVASPEEVAVPAGRGEVSTGAGRRSFDDIPPSLRSPAVRELPFFDEPPTTVDDALRRLVVQYGQRGSANARLVDKACAVETKEMELRGASAQTIGRYEKQFHDLFRAGKQAAALEDLVSQWKADPTDDDKLEWLQLLQSKLESTWRDETNPDYQTLLRLVTGPDFGRKAQDVLDFCDEAIEHRRTSEWQDPQLIAEAQDLKRVFSLLQQCDPSRESAGQLLTELQAAFDVVSIVGRTFLPLGHYDEMEVFNKLLNDLPPPNSIETVVEDVRVMGVHPLDADSSVPGLQSRGARVSPTFDQELSTLRDAYPIEQVRAAGVRFRVALRLRGMDAPASESEDLWHALFDRKSNPSAQRTALRELGNLLGMVASSGSDESPTRVMHDLGQFIGQTWVQIPQGIQETAEFITDSMANDLLSEIAVKAFTAGEEEEAIQAEVDEVTRVLRSFRNPSLPPSQQACFDRLEQLVGQRLGISLSGDVDGQKLRSVWSGLSTQSSPSSSTVESIQQEDSPHVAEGVQTGTAPVHIEPGVEDVRAPEPGMEDWDLDFASAPIFGSPSGQRIAPTFDQTLSQLGKVYSPKQVKGAGSRLPMALRLRGRDDEAAASEKLWEALFNPKSGPAAQRTALQGLGKILGVDTSSGSDESLKRAMNHLDYFIKNTWVEVPPGIQQTVEALTDDKANALIGRMKHRFEWLHENDDDPVQREEAIQAGVEWFENVLHGFRRGGPFPAAQQACFDRLEQMVEGLGFNLSGDLDGQKLRSLIGELSIPEPIQQENGPNVAEDIPADIDPFNRALAARAGEIWLPGPAIPLNQTSAAQPVDWKEKLTELRSLDEELVSNAYQHLTILTPQLESSFQFNMDWATIFDASSSPEASRDALLRLADVMPGEEGRFLSSRRGIDFATDNAIVSSVVDWLKEFVTG